MKPVILLGGNVISLIFIRSLGKRGIPLTILSYNPNDIGKWSKYVKDCRNVPHPQREPKAYLNALLKLKKSHAGALVVPVNDDTLEVVAKHKRMLEKHFVVGCSNWNIHKVFLEKERSYALCEKIGVPYPKVWKASTLKQVRNISKKVIYPCLVKPVISHEFYKDFRCKAFRCNDEGDLLKYMAKVLSSGHKVMIQEYIEGSDARLHAMMIHIDSSNRLLTSIHREKVRQNPPSLGIGRVTKLSRPNKVLEAYSLEFLRAGKFKGIACVEFKQDSKGVFRLIEANTRMPRSGNLTILSGSDIPYNMYQDLVLGEKAHLVPQKTHGFWIDIYADVLNTLLRHGQESWSINDYIYPYTQPKIFAVWDWRDPLPFIAQVCKLPGKYVRRFMERGRKQ